MLYKKFAGVDKYTQDRSLYSMKRDKPQRRDHIGAIIRKWPTTAAHSYNKLLADEKRISDADRALLSKPSVLNAISRLTPASIGRVVWFLGDEAGRKNIPILTSDRMLRSFTKMKSWNDLIVARVLNSVVSTLPSQAVTDERLIGALDLKRDDWKAAVYIAALTVRTKEVEALAATDVINLISRTGVVDTWIGDDKINILIARMKRNDTRFTDERFLLALDNLQSNQRSAMLVAAFDAENLDRLFSIGSMLFAMKSKLGRPELIEALIQNSKAQNGKVSQHSGQRSLLR